MYVPRLTTVLLTLPTLLIGTSVAAEPPAVAPATAANTVTGGVGIIGTTGSIPDVTAVGDCKDSLDVAIFQSPRWPSRSRPLRILVASEKPLPDARIAVLTPTGKTIELPVKRYGGPPYGIVAEVAKPVLGIYTAVLGNGSRIDACQKMRIRKFGNARNASPGGVDPIWRARIKWERDTENLYSLWIEHLFDAPQDQDISWKRMHFVTRDSKRNLLFNHLGLREDNNSRAAIRLKPDCADFPYFTRAYFAWKLGLPFGYRGCIRGNAKRAPRCGKMISQNQVSEQESKTKAFEWFARKKVAGTVHSSTLRTLPRAEASDFYPVALTRKGLRPGTVYADPYGHTFMVGKWLPQVGDKAGTLIAVDAQPDGTIGRRTFWKGSFLFPKDGSVKGAGWKRFRPVRRTRMGWQQMTNAQIKRSIDYGDFSTEQWDNGNELFYEAMDALITPNPLAPGKALTALVEALFQQVRRRVESAENGEQWKRKNGRRTMRMPDGGAIFITAGPWEDYSTPSRDLRLLIAMDTVRDFPNRVAKYPKRFRLDPAKPMADVVKELSAMVVKLTMERSVTYKRSDGTPWKLTLNDVMQRNVQFEYSYNPNDCIEKRWGALPGSEEVKPCQRHAPASHRRKMERYRVWFQKRQRPVS